MVIRRIGPLSVAKLAGALYALMGLLIGAIFSVVGIVGASLGSSDSGLAGMLFGVGAIIVLPMFYRVLGFVMTLIMAALYNLLAGWFGGVEIELVADQGYRAPVAPSPMVGPV